MQEHDRRSHTQVGSHTIETWSVTQKLVALSSAESEFYAMGSGAARALTVKHVLQEILGAQAPDRSLKLTLFMDSNAAKGMIHRQGVGRVRHLQTRYFWHQDALRRGEFEVAHVTSKDNPADAGTKPLEEDIVKKCCDTFSLKSRALTSFALLALLPQAAEAKSHDMVVWQPQDCIEVCVGSRMLLKCVITLACIVFPCAGPCGARHVGHQEEDRHRPRRRASLFEMCSFRGR